MVDAGTTVVLNCQAEGEPTPVIEWSRQGRPLLGKDHFSTLSNSSLRVSSAQKEDTAEYECVARNLLGSVLVRVSLTVRGELHIVGIYCCNIYPSLFFILLSKGKRKQTNYPNWSIFHVYVHLFVFQYMGATQSGQSGVLAACPVVLGPRRGSGSATILYLPMEGVTVQDQTQRHAVVRESLVQVRVL